MHFVDACLETSTFSLFIDYRVLGTARSTLTRQMAVLSCCSWGVENLFNLMSNGTLDFIAAKQPLLLTFGHGRVMGKKNKKKRDKTAGMLILAVCAPPSFELCDEEKHCRL